LPGVRLVPYGDLAAMEAAVRDETVAIMVEPIQGEGGVVVPPPDYLAGLRALAERRDVLLILDEIQCGLGRTGRLFAHEHAGVTPSSRCVAWGSCWAPSSSGPARPSWTTAARPGSSSTARRSACSASCPRWSSRARRPTRASRSSSGRSRPAREGSSVKRDLLRIADLSTQEIEAILALAKRLKDELRDGTPHPLLAGRTLAMIFEKPSLRTRVTFEVGMVQLGGAAMRLGFGFVLACPPGYEPDPSIIAEARPHATITHDVEIAARGADVLYTDVWTSMGQEAEAKARRRAFVRYQVNERVVALAGP